MTRYDLLLRQAKVVTAPDNSIDKQLVDIAIKDGKIVSIASTIDGDAELELNIDGKLVSPPFVESHIHLDSALTAGTPRWNQSGTLFEGIQIWSERKQNLSTLR